MKILILAFLLISINAVGQGRHNNTWCFGDSAKINFNNGVVNAQGISYINTEKFSSSISDYNGSLLFYIGTPFIQNLSQYEIQILNRNDQVMLNGDSIYGLDAWSSSLIIPFVNDTNRYYALTLYNGVIPYHGIYYSIVDMTLDSGLGAVTARNQQIFSQDYLAPKFAAVKHANGWDWWIFCHKMLLGDTSNTFVRILLDSSGINRIDSQSIGTYYGSNIHGGYEGGQMVFSQDGTKLVAVGSNVIDLYDFDRCTGTLSNWKSLAPSGFTSPDNWFHGCSFSKDGTRFYVSTEEESTGKPDLYQFDLTAANIGASKVKLYSASDSLIRMCDHQIGPDGKIYISTTYGDFPLHYNNIYTNNLSVINYPDSAGLQCNFQIASVPIGNGKITAGLPNMPNYNLGAMPNECANYTPVLSKEDENKLNIFPNPISSEELTLTSNTLTEPSTISIFNTDGKEVVCLTPALSKGEGERKSVLHIKLPKLASGMYFVVLQAGERRMTGRFVKQ